MKNILSACLFIFLSTSIQAQDKLIKIGEVTNEIRMGKFAGNTNLAYGVQNILEEILMDMDYYLDDYASESDSPIKSVVNDSFKASLVKEIDSLPEREKLVLSLYYEEELNLKEIGLVLSVSESRVSQIHAQAAMRLRSRLMEWS